MALSFTHFGPRLDATQASQGVNAAVSATDALLQHHSPDSRLPNGQWVLYRVGGFEIRLEDAATGVVEDALTYSILRTVVRGLRVYFRSLDGYYEVSFGLKKFYHDSRGWHLFGQGLMEIQQPEILDPNIVATS